MALPPEHLRIVQALQRGETLTVEDGLLTLGDPSLCVHAETINDMITDGILWKDFRLSRKYHIYESYQEFFDEIGEKAFNIYQLMKMRRKPLKGQQGYSIHVRNKRGTGSPITLFTWSQTCNF
jgi:hypothetical protein